MKVSSKYIVKEKNIKKLIITLLPIAVLMTQAHLPINTYVVSNNVMESSDLLVENKNNEEERLLKTVMIEPDSNRNNNANESLEWSNKNFPNVFSEDISHIKTINSQLRTVITMYDISRFLGATIEDFFTF